MKRPTPSPEQIRAARKQAGLTQTAAADLVETDLRVWQQWEHGERKMHAGFWRLFCLLTNPTQEK